MTARATNTSAQASRHDVAVRFLAAATLVLTRSRRNGRSFRRSKFAAATATRRKPPIILDHTDDGGCGDYDAWFMSGQLRASSVFVTGFGVAAVLGVVVALAAPAVSDASVKRRDPCYPRTRGRALPRLLRDSFVRCVRRELHKRGQSPNGRSRPAAGQARKRTQASRGCQREGSQGSRGTSEGDDHFAARLAWAGCRTTPEGGRWLREEDC